MRVIVTNVSVRSDGAIQARDTCDRFVRGVHGWLPDRLRDRQDATLTKRAKPAHVGCSDPLRSCDMASFATVRLMPPPYVREIPWTAVPELGSILIWQPHAGSAASEIRDLYLTVPWCSLCIVSDDVGHQGLGAIVDAVMPLPCLPVVVHSPDNIVAAIRRRRPPSLEEAVKVLVHRADSPEFAIALSMLAANGRTPAHDRSLRRAFDRHSRFGPRHWKHVLHLAGLKLKEGEAAETMAERYGTDVRTLRRHVEACLGVAFERFRQMVGWEWRVEAAVRLDRDGAAHGRRGGGVEALS